MNTKWALKIRIIPACSFVTDMYGARSQLTDEASFIANTIFLYIILHYTRQPCEFGHVVKNTTGWKTPAHIFHFLSEENFIYDASFLIFYIPVSSDLPTLRHKRRTIDNHGGLSYLCYQIIVYIILELI